MITWERIIELAEGLPEVQVLTGEKLVIRRGKRDLAWQRPLSKKYMKALGDAAPTGEVLAVHVADLLEKEAWLLAEPGPLFTTPHFANYPAVLVDLELAGIELVRELLDQ